MEKYDKGYHKGVRWITDLSRREDVNVAKLFMDMGIKIRSIRNLLPPNFLVTDRVFFSNSEKIVKPLSRCLQQMMSYTSTSTN